MYTVYCDGTKIYDLYTELYLIDPVLELELNSPGTFEFTMPADHPYFDLPQEMISRVWVIHEDEEIFRGRVIQEEVDFYNQKKVYCEGELAFLNDSIQRPAEYHNLSVRDYFKALIENHNEQVEEDKQFEIGYVLISDDNDSLYRYTNYNSTLEEMKEDLVEDYGGYIRVRNQDGHRYLDYVDIDNYGVRNGQAIRFGVNLLDYTQTMDLTDIATVIIPLGERLEESPIEALDMRLTIESVNGGSDAIESEEAVETFGRIVKTVVWDDVTQASNLLTKGQKYLSDYQWDPLVLEVTPIDLHDTDPDTETFHLGDELRVISSPHGLDRYFPVSAMTIHLDSLDQNTFTLGTEIKGKTLTGTIQTTINQVSEVEKEITPTQIILNQAKEQASNLINAATHGYVVLQPNDAPEEILIMNEPNFEDATQVWRWNLGGLGYGTRAKKTDDFYFKTAMTMDGAIVADFITTGSLTANIIKAGTIQDVRGYNSWNLDTGVLTATNGTFSGSLNAATGTFHGELTNESGKYKTVINNGRVNIYYDDELYGTIQPVYSNGQAKYLSFLASSDGAAAISIGVGGTGYLFVNNGQNPNGYSERVQISGTTRMTGSLYCRNIYLNGYYLYLNDNCYIYSSSSNSNTYFRGGNIYTGSSCGLSIGNYALSGYMLRVAGSAYASGGWYNSSDESLKENINPLSSKTETFIDKLKPISYEFKDDESKKIHFGVTYQNVRESLEAEGINPDESAIISTATDDGGNEVGTVAYSELIAPLIYEVKTLKEQVAELKEEIEGLKAKIE